jgi:hypothetical protein
MTGTSGTDGRTGGPRARKRTKSAAAALLAEPAGRAAAILAAGAAVVIGLVTTGWQPIVQTDRQVAVRLHALALDHPAWTHTNRILELNRIL